MKSSVTRKALCERYLTGSVIRNLVSVVSLLLTAGTAWCQISVENQGVVHVPEQRAWVIYQTACQVVAEKFQVKSPAELQVPFRLVVGTTDSGVLYDEGEALYQIHLKSWGDTEFAFAALRLTLQRLVTSRSRRTLLLETLVRAERKLPVSQSSASRQTPQASGRPQEQHLCPSGISTMNCLIGSDPRNRH